MKSTEVTIKVQLDRFLQLCQGCKVLCFAHANIINNWANSLHVRNVQGTQMKTGVIHFMSEILRGIQMTYGVIHFVSKKLRGTKMTTGVIHFVSDMVEGSQITVGVIPFMLDLARNTQMTVGVNPFMSAFNQIACIFIWVCHPTNIVLFVIQVSSRVSGARPDTCKITGQ